MAGKPTLDLNPVVYDITGESAFTYLARAKALAEQGMDIVSFGIGQPDLPTPST